MHRCPICKKGLEVDRVEGLRWLFYCKRCNIAKVIDEQDKDYAYLEFMSLYDQDELDRIEDVLVKEGFVRSKEEIKAIIDKHGIDDPIIIRVLNTDKDYVAYYNAFQPSDPDYGASVDEINISKALKDRLKGKGIDRLYRFQEHAINAIKDGKDIVIVAPTASGKTEAFAIPIIDMLNKGRLEALFVYPTKALARDQFSKIRYYASALGIDAAILDGDTPIAERKAIIARNPEIILTNFDTLHYHLIHRTEFSLLLRNIKYLAVDEVHVYNGIFGSHIHYIVKRLERLSGRLQIAAASATLPNAKEFCSRLFDRDMHMIVGKGKRSKIHFAMLYPTLRSNRALMLELIKLLVSNGHKVLAFNDSHISAELLAYYGLKQGIDVKVHRAGLLQSYRQRVEEEFKNNKIMAISSTPTLELGIDIGSIDAVISSKAPINRLLQRLGRAARREQVGYAFLAFSNDPISQYYKNHPDHYMNDYEYAYIDPYNPTVQKYQILAMACDKPLPESYYDDYSKAIDELVDEGLLEYKNNRYIARYSKAIKYLHELNIRGSGKSISIYLKNRKIGERSLPLALEELHDQAVYFLASRRYQVERLDLKEYKAYLKQLPSNYPYYTKALSEEWPFIEEVYEQRYAYAIEVKHCLLRIVKKVIGYTNIEIGSDVVKGKRVLLDEPLEYEFVTKGLVFKAPRPLDAIADAKDPIKVEMSSYHAAEHVVIEGNKMLIGGASQDLGGISLGSSGLIFVYDSSIGGNGASKVLYNKLEQAFARSKSILEECPCNSIDGCPRCTYSYRCGNNNEFLHKEGSLEVFKRILNNEQTRIDSIEADVSLV